MEGIQQEHIKGSKLVVVLGILSFVGCIFYALPGTVIAIMGILRFRKVKAIVDTNRPAYEEAYVNARVGLILCILGFIASIITLIWTISLFKDVWFK